jgi:hypothetical protein
VHARFQHEQSVRGVIANVGFHGDHAGVLEKLVLRDERKRCWGVPLF